MILKIQNHTLGLVNEYASFDDLASAFDRMKLDRQKRQVGATAGHSNRLAGEVEAFELAAAFLRNCKLVVEG